MTFKPTAAFSSFAVKDTEKTLKFYSQTLGLKVTPGPEGSLELATGHGAKVMVYPKPDHVPATFTVLNFPVDDVEASVTDLKKAGVSIETYAEGPVKTDEKGIFRRNGTKMAWFKDPAGNILSVVENRKT